MKPHERDVKTPSSSETSGGRTLETLKVPRQLNFRRRRTHVLRIDRHHLTEQP